MREETNNGILEWVKVLIFLFVAFSLGFFLGSKTNSQITKEWEQMKLDAFCKAAGWQEARSLIQMGHGDGKKYVKCVSDNEDQRGWGTEVYPDDL